MGPSNFLRNKTIILVRFCSNIHEYEALGFCSSRESRTRERKKPGLIFSSASLSLVWPPVHEKSLSSAAACILRTQAAAAVVSEPADGDMRVTGCCCFVARVCVSSFRINSCLLDVVPWTLMLSFCQAVKPKLPLVLCCKV